MRKIFPLFIAFVFANAGNLSEIILAAQSSNLAQISALEPQKAQLQKSSAKSSYMPNLSIEGGLNFLSGDINVLRPKAAATISAKLEVLLYDGGRREALLDALSDLSAAQIYKNEDYQNLLALNVAKLYFNFLALNNLLTAKDSEANYLKNALARLEKYYKAGLSNESEFEAINARYALAVSERLELLQKQNEIKNQIYALSGKDTAPVCCAKISPPNLNENGKKPELRALELNFAAALKDEKIVAAKANPQIFIRDVFTFMRTKYNKNLIPQQYRATLEPYFQQFFKPNLNSNEVLLGFSWQIFDFGANKKEREIKQLAAQQSRLNLEQHRLQNKINLANLKSDLAVLEQKITAQKSALNSAQISLNAISKKYEAGLLGYVEFLNATAQSFNAASALELGRSELEIKRAEFLYESGEKILVKVIDE